jgi:hypothetical protein
MDSAIYMVESGHVLEMVKEHIRERLRVSADVGDMLKELGTNTCSRSRFNGTLAGVVFPGAVHPQFTKPDREGVSRPKKNTDWHGRFKAQKGYRELEGWISKELGVPLVISYKGKDCSGSRCIGAAFNACGFLYPCADGPYALYIPDVAAEVAATIAEGYEVEGPAPSFNMDIEGCRRVEKEEWEMVVLQHKLAKKKAA